MTDFDLERPVDPGNILWKNMQIKSAEQGVRCFFVVLTLVCLIYFSFLIQANFAAWKFNTAIFESIDCQAQHQGTNRTQMQSMAFSTWSDYNMEGQFKKDIMKQKDDLDLEPPNAVADSTSLVNGTLACFCDAETDRIGWLNTVFQRYKYNPIS